MSSDISGTISHEAPPTSPDRSAKDAWRALRILSEFVTGFERMVALGPAVTFFGSARIKQGHQYYQLARETARLVAEKGFVIATGGGPGLMEAANRGAQEAGGASCGVRIEMPLEPENPYIDPRYSIILRYFFVRKVLLVRYARAYVILPGGFGTLDELFEVLTLMQASRIRSFPVFLMGKKYWQGLLKWVEETVHAEGCVRMEELNFLQITDDPKDVVEGIVRWHELHHQVENF